MHLWAGHGSRPLTFGVKLDACYRIYSLDGSGHIMGPPKLIDADDQDAAVKEARQILDGREIEVWCGDRCVARLRPEDK
jgi:hypothetical protein